VPKTASVIKNNEEDISQRQSSHLNNPASSSGPRTFPTILKIVVGAVKRNLLEENGSDTNNLPKILTMDDVLKKAKRRHGINLDPKQTKAYEMICTTLS
jgi:hypothetical protein